MTIFNHQDGQYLSIDGARIYYEQQGQQDGLPLVLLHGGLGDIGTFNTLTPHLGRRYRLIGIDSRGQGRSTLGCKPLSYQRLQRDVEAVLEQLGVNHASIIGHSDGGIVALRLAASSHVRVEKLVTIGAHWALHPDDPVRDMYSGITATDWCSMFPDSVASYQSANPEPDFETLVQAVKGLWLDDSEAGYPQEAVRGIQAGLLIVRGDEDSLVSRTNALELANRVAGAMLLNLPFAGHSAHEDRPQWLLPVLDEFLLLQPPEPLAGAGVPTQGP